MGRDYLAYQALAAENESLREQVKRPKAKIAEYEKASITGADLAVAMETKGDHKI